MFKNLSQVKRTPVAQLLGGLLSENRSDSIHAAQKLIGEAKECGLSFQDYLKLSALPTDDKEGRKYEGLNGFEASLAFLNLPFRDNLEQGVFLQAASDTFQKFPGTRAMFPEVIDQMLRWKNRQPNIETLAPLLAQSRTITGSEMISTAVEDDSAARGTYAIPELGRIPIRTIRTSQTSVGIYKHGSGIRTSYEFERRASLDILTPFAARVSRELEVSKIKAATQILINGDGVNGAAGTINITDANVGGVVVGTNKFRNQYAAFASWLVYRASLGLPIDIVVGNVKMYLELLLMFTPTLGAVKSEAEALAAAGGPALNLNIPLLGGAATFALSSAVPDNRLIGYTKAETLEELVEAGSQISENERSIENQSVTYVRTENSGFKLAYGDTRSILVLDA